MLPLMKLCLHSYGHDLSSLLLAHLDGLCAAGTGPFFISNLVGRNLDVALRHLQTTQSGGILPTLGRTALLGGAYPVDQGSTGTAVQGKTPFKTTLYCAGHPCSKKDEVKTGAEAKKDL